MVEHFNIIQANLGQFPSYLLEDIVESEVYAAENETPNMDLLTCTSTTTNNISSKGIGRRDVSATIMTTTNADVPDLICTGKLNAQAGLGPLDELFNVYHQAEIGCANNVDYDHNNITHQQQQQQQMYSEYTVPLPYAYDQQIEDYEQHHKDNLQPLVYNNATSNDYCLQPMEWSTGSTVPTCDYSTETNWNCYVSQPPSYHYSSVNNNTNIYYKNIEQPVVPPSSNNIEYYDETQINTLSNDNMMVSMEGNYYYNNYDNNHHHHLQDIRCTDVYY